jgi:hypothetical protein
MVNKEKRICSTCTYYTYPYQLCSQDVGMKYHESNYSCKHWESRKESDELAMAYGVYFEPNTQG